MWYLGLCKRPPTLLVGWRSAELALLGTTVHAVAAYCSEPDRDRWRVIGLRKHSALPKPFLVIELVAFAYQGFDVFHCSC